MDLRRLVTLKAIVEEGSFVRAAQKLCCTQSTVTFHIQQLEQELSVQLFEKIGRRMQLTQAGKSLMPHVHELIQALEMLHQAARQEQPSGELRVAIGETLLAYKMPEVLRQFRLQAPQVRLSLCSLNCYTIRDALLAGEVDLGVLYRVSDDLSLHTEDLGTFPLTLVASPNLEPMDFITPNQYLPTSLIINEPQCVFRLIFENVLRERNIVLENTLELWSIESIKKCVAGNLGISCLPYFTVEEELRSGVLKELPFFSEPRSITAICAHHVSKWISPAMRLFMDVVKAA